MAPKTSQSCPPQLWNSHPGHRFKTNKVKGRQHKTLMAVSNAHEMTCSLWGCSSKGASHFHSNGKYFTFRSGGSFERGRKNFRVMRYFHKPRCLSPKLLFSPTWGVSN